MTFRDNYGDYEDTIRDEVESERIRPARPVTGRTGLQSADPVLSICVHELARALEEYARKQYIALFQGDIEFETAAIEIAGKMGAEKCQLKNV